MTNETPVTKTEEMPDTDLGIDEIGISEENAVAQLLKRFGVPENEDGESPSKSAGTKASDVKEDSQEGEKPQKDAAERGDEEEAAGEDDEADDEGEGEEQEAEDDDGDADEEGEEEAPVVDDNARVVITVDGEEQEVTVGSLKRLAGQEKALTHKSQAVAEARAKYEESLKVQRTALEEMVKRAQKRFEPYQKIDFALAAREYDRDTYEALKEEAQAAYSDLVYYKDTLGQVVANQDKERTEALERAAKAAVEELKDPEKGIPNFDANLYRSMYEYAVSAGADPEMLDEVVHPAAWKMIYKAMRYDRLQQAKGKAKQAKQGKVRKVVKTERTVEPKKANASTERRKRLESIRKLEGLDSVQAAADELFARFNK